MKITILLFASLRERAGKNKLTIELEDGATVADVTEAVGLRHPELCPYLSAIAVAVNQVRVDYSCSIHDNDVVAFLPPVSGGCGDQDYYSTC